MRDMFSKLFDFAKRHRQAILTVVGSNTVLYYVWNLPQLRAERLKYKFSSEVPDFSLHSLPYVPQSALVADLNFECTEGATELGGVRIVWAVSGAGKTTTIKRTLNNLLSSKEIAGFVYLTPPHDKRMSPAEWFRASLSDFGGPLLLPGEKLSDVLGYAKDKPVVIVFDQIEANFLIDEHFEQLIRSLAYDSDDCKSYIVLLATSDPDKAREIYQWNGGTKMSFLGRHFPWQYRWTEHEIQQWLDKYVEILKDEKHRNQRLIDGLSHGSRLRDSIVNTALQAGTPAFLIRAIHCVKQSYDLEGAPVDPKLPKFAWENGKFIIEHVLGHNTTET